LAAGLLLITAAEPLAPRLACKAKQGASQQVQQVSKAEHFEHHLHSGMQPWLSFTPGTL
jgi:hypothetical protein